MFDPYAVVETILVTEKSMAQQDNNKYLFKVKQDATKIEIARAIEAIYNVKVKSVNVINRAGKPKRLGRRSMKQGRTSDVKRAVVTLSEGKIEII